MFNYDIKYIEKTEFDNLVLSKKMEVWESHVFLILDTDNKKIADLLLNKVIDLLVENLLDDDIYNSFSKTLEKINLFLKEIKIEEQEVNINLIIWVLDKTWNLFFSKIWKASVYLVRNLNEISEITDRKSKFEEFTFVSSWKLESWDLIFFANKRLLNYLAKSDLIEVWAKEDLEKAWEWIVKILKEEKTKSNISFISLKFLWDPSIEKKSENDDSFLSFLFVRIKKFYKIFVKFLKKLLKKNKILKNFILILGIIISIYILYIFISSVLNVWGLSSKIEDAKKEITVAKKYINMANHALEQENKELFNLNITKAENIVNDLKTKKVLRDDVKKLASDIYIFQKEFNKVSVYSPKKENLIYPLEKKDFVKILKTSNKKVYIIWKKSVTWPIIEWLKVKTNYFSDIWNDEFIDAIDVNWVIMLLTKNSRVVKFSWEKKFSYIDVSWQAKWENAKIIKSFWRNIYLVERKTNQIYKHSFLTSTSYKEGLAYIPKDDLLWIWKILAIWIDGGFYIFNDDLKIKKFFRDKKQLNTLQLKRLPLNFKWDKKSKVDIILPDNNKFLYLLMNNKIWVFKVDFPNANRKVKTLIYVWQIENEEWKIISFIEKDENFFILTDKWIYKVITNFKRDDKTWLYSLELVD